LLDLLDKHIKEEMCGRSAKELLKEYEKLTTVNQGPICAQNKFIER